MSSICPEISIVINMAMNTGNEIKEKVTDWSEMDLVIYFDKKLTDAMRHELKMFNNLDYHRMELDPHYAKEELFICNKCKKMGISFPLN